MPGQREEEGDGASFFYGIARCNANARYCFIAMILREVAYAHLEC